MGRGLEHSTSGDVDTEDNGDVISTYETDGSTMTQRKYPRGKRMVIDELDDLGLTTDELRRLGLDVLNPEGVAKMLK